MRLKSFLVERLDTTDFFDREISQSLDLLDKKIKNMGFTRKPYAQQDFKFRDDDREVCLFYADGVFELLIYVVDSELASSVKEPGKFNLIANFEVKGKYTTDGTDTKLMEINVGALSKEDVLEDLKTLNESMGQLEGFTDWFFDVTGKHPGVKLQVHRHPFASANKRGIFPSGIKAVGGEFSFHGKEDRAKIY